MFFPNRDRSTPFRNLVTMAWQAPCWAIPFAIFFGTLRGGAQRLASLVLARLNPEGTRLTYCNAGHNPPLLRRRDGTRVLLQEGGMLLGVAEDATFHEADLALIAGDRVLFYTDGIVEAIDSEGEEFQLHRLDALMETLAGTSSSEMMTAIVKTVDQFANGVELTDDRTILLLSVRTGAPASRGFHRRWLRPLPTCRERL